MPFHHVRFQKPGNLALVRSVKDAGNPLDQHFQRIGENVGHILLPALLTTSDLNNHPAVLWRLQPRSLHFVIAGSTESIDPQAGSVTWLLALSDFPYPNLEEVEVKQPPEDSSTVIIEA